MMRVGSAAATDAVGKDAKIMTDSARHDLGGTFYQPTGIDRATREMKIADEETFGTIATIFEFDTEDEAVELANNTDFRLAFYFYTRDPGHTFKLSSSLSFGSIGVNEAIITTEVAPFGGLRHSGFGAEESMSGIAPYLDAKDVCVGGLD